MRVVFAARALFAVAFAVVFTAVMSVITILVSALRWQSAADACVHFWSKGLLASAGLRVRVRGMEHVPMHTGVLFVFNHQSHYDIPCIAGTIPKRIRFGAKSELFKIPLFGPAIRIAGTLPIVRESRAEVFKVYKDAEWKFAKNWNFVLAPEGTRQQKPEIGRFKRGPFIFAANAQVQLVPVVLKGVHDYLPKGRLLPNTRAWSHRVEMEILPPVDMKGRQPDEIAGITDQVRQAMVESYARL